MTERWVAVLAVPADRAGKAAPPGVDRTTLALAMLEDVGGLLAELAGVRAALAASPPALAASTGELMWPGTPVLPVLATTTGAETVAALEGLQGLGADEAVVVAADAPDLPGLLVAKLFAGLAGAPAAVCPAAGGGLVALACRLPVPGWVRLAEVGLDSPDALQRLRRTAPRRRDLVVGPGWHRLRNPAALTLLDPGLEGWPVTRALLSGPTGAG